MIRSIFGFAVFAVIAYFALGLIGALFGGLIGLIIKILYLAFWGWIFYLVLKLFAPETAAKLRHTITGKPA